LEASVTTAAPAHTAGAEQHGDEDRVDRLRAAIGKLSRALRLSHSATGLTPSQVSVLFTICRRGPLKLSEVVELEGLNPTMLSRITAELSEQGLIRRRADSEDRRAAVVEPTAAGRRMRERIHTARSRALGQRIELLEEHDQTLIWEALPALEQLVETLAEPRR
jgi:DNA-binding MarR family transcriptional regulator